MESENIKKQLSQFQLLKLPVDYIYNTDENSDKKLIEYFSDLQGMHGFAIIDLSSSEGSRTFGKVISAFPFANYAEQTNSSSDILASLGAEYRPWSAQQFQIALEAEGTDYSARTNHFVQRLAKVPSAVLQMLARNNEIRISRGLRPHLLDMRLYKAAQDHANYMARTGSFSHYVNGGPQNRAFRFGFRGSVRENIAWNQGSVHSAFVSWVNSSGHYASIISNTTYAGFAVAYNQSGQPYWVGVYGN